MGIITTKMQRTNNASVFNAIRENDYERATTLVSDQFGKELDCRDLNGSTPLIEACKNPIQSEKLEEERENFVKALIDNGCDLSKCDIHGNTAFVYAAENNDYEIASILERKERKLSLIENRIDEVDPQGSN